MDRLYSHRKSGGRGLNSIRDLSISRIISISRHLKEQANQNEFLSMVSKHEKEALVKVADELIIYMCLKLKSLKHLPQKNYLKNQKSR